MASAIGGLKRKLAAPLPSPVVAPATAAAAAASVGKKKPVAAAAAEIPRHGGAGGGGGGGGGGCACGGGGCACGDSDEGGIDEDEEGEPAAAAAAGHSSSHAHDWTRDPNVQLVDNEAALFELLRITKARVAALKKGGVVDRTLLRKLGEKVEALAGYEDFAFFQELPPEGTKVVAAQSLCPLKDKTLADGAATLTGSFINAFERHLGLPLMRSNIAGACWRKGKGGVELKRGQAGCVDPTGATLRVLAAVKELYMLGLIAAGLIVVGIIASSNASFESFGVHHSKEHFVAHVVDDGIYAGVPIYGTPHAKFVSPTCVNNASVATRIGGSLGDPLSTTSRVVDGWARMGAMLLGRKGAALERAAKSIYEGLRADESSRAVVREWLYRFTTTTTPETEARLKKAQFENSSKGGENVGHF